MAGKSQFRGKNLGKCSAKNDTLPDGQSRVGSYIILEILPLTLLCWFKEKGLIFTREKTIFDISIRTNTWNSLLIWKVL
jgi:hypothetical protein